MTPERRRAAFDAIVFQNLRPGAAGLSVLYLIFGMAHWRLLPEPARSPMTLIAFGSAGMLFGIWSFLRHKVVPERAAHPLAACLAGVVLFNSLAHAYFTATPRETTNLILLAIGAGFILLSTVWLLALLASGFAGWWLTMSLVGAWPEKFYFDWGLVSASVLAIVVQIGRMRTYTRLEQLHLREELRHQELERAFAQAQREIAERKRAEADLEAIREALETRVKERTAELARANEALRSEIAERSRAETALRKSEAGLVLAQKIGHVGSWELDLATETLTWSDETFRIFGRDPQTFTPTRASFFDAVHPDDRTAVKMAVSETLRKRNPSYSIDHRILRPDGSEHTVCERAEVVFDPEGNPVRLVGTVQDITERNVLEDQLRHSQKMDAIGQLAAGVAHDFNNLLTIIKGHTDLLQDPALSAAEEKELIEQISGAAERAANLTCQLLLFSRKQMMQPRWMDLNESIHNLTKMLGRILGEDVALEVRPAPHLSRIHADPGMIEQVIVNLAVNARDAMPSGGKLTLATSEMLVAQTKADRNPEARPGQFVRLSVTDTGCGIAPEDLPRIFEPFFTTKPVGKGTGLGLSIVYGIIKQHRGWIEVASDVNRGATFHVFLPAAPRLMEPLPERSPAPVLRGGTECVLVVEDERSVRQLVVRLLRTHGYRVWEAGSGIEALSVWKERSHEIDLLLTDLVMPGGVSGRDLADRFRREKESLKVIYTSGYSTDFSNLEPTLRRGTRFLPKPFHLPDLVHLVRECLDE